MESLKSFKAAGPDEIMAEVLKAGGTAVVDWMHRIIQKVWRTETVVEEWRMSTIVPVLKKGDNYRGISLLSIPSKVLAKVLYRRIEEKVEPQLHEAQCGFRKGRGCVDQIFNLRECMSASRQKGKPLYVCFIDLRKAYDSVNRELLWQAMKTYGISGKIVRIVSSLYENTRAKVRVNGVLSECLLLKTGVKQGCVLSPLLFNIFIDWVVRRVLKSMGDSGIEIRYSKKKKELHVKEKDRTARTLVNMLMYADDMAVMDSECGNVSRFLVELDEQLCRVGMMMNVKKTKMMVLDGKIEEPIMIRGEKIEEENNFTYLGVSMRPEPSSGAEVAIRIAKAVKVFRALYHPLWKRRQVSVETKIGIYRAAVLPVLLYGAEVWVLSVKESTRLEVFHRKCLRVILGITKRDHWRNERVLEETGMCDVGELVTRSRLRWLGHVVRMGEDRLPPQMLYGSLEGRGKVGRPVGRWKDMIEGDIRKREVIGWYDLAQDRKLWRSVVAGERIDAAVKRRRRGMQLESRQKQEDSKQEDGAMSEGVDMSDMRPKI